MPAPEVNDIISEITRVRSSHSDRRSQQRVYQSLGRNRDPRSLPDNSVSETRLIDFGNDPHGRRMKINHPMAYLLLMQHLLTGEPGRWRMPHMPTISQEQRLKYGKAERAVAGIFLQNDSRLMNTGQPRFVRMVSDSLTRYGMIVVYKDVLTQGDQTRFVMQPWSPLEISEEFDDFGLKQIVREYSTDTAALIARGKSLDWDVSQLEQRLKAGAHSVKVMDYWGREYRKGLDTPRVTHAFLLENSDRPILAPEEVDREDIPVEVFKVNGEAFPGEEKWREAYSVLEPNVGTYLEMEDTYRMIEDHNEKSRSDQKQEFTHAGVPKANPGVVNNPRGGASLTTYDVARGEQGMNVVPMNPVDPAIQYRFQMNEIAKQQGSVPDALFGAIDFTLSGFALQTVLRAARSVAGELVPVLDLAMSRLGKWVLDSIKDGKTAGTLTLEMPSAQTSKREWFVEDFGKADIPETTIIRHETNLSTPSDLFERISMARQANPEAPQLFTQQTIYEEMFQDIVPDSQAEMDAVNAARVNNTEFGMVLQMHRALRLKLKQAEEDGDQFAAQVYQKQIEMLEQQFAQSQNQQTRGTSGGPDQRAQPTEVRAGANGQAVNGRAAQQANGFR